jgi:uncharacterized protein DUF1707
MVGVGQEGTTMSSSADAMRASDEDREKVVAALQEQVGLGRLTLAEFEERSTAAYAAVTVGDLRELTKDLPIDVFPRPTPTWQPQIPMPAAPPWTRGQLPARRGASPLLIAFGVFFGLIVIGSVFSAISVGAHFVFPLLPLFFVLMVLLRRGSGPGRGYRR